MKPAKSDTTKIFLAYLSVQGDIDQTAMACDLEPEAIEALAKQQDWARALNRFSALKENDPKFQIGLNRVLNYVQARQLSALVDKVIVILSESPEALIDKLTSVTKNGATFDVKPITDLCRAADLCHAMANRALGDTGGNSPENEKLTTGAIGLSVAKALNEVANNKGVDAVTLVQRSLNENSEPKSIADSPTVPGSETK